MHGTGRMKTPDLLRLTVALAFSTLLACDSDDDAGDDMDPRDAAVGWEATNDVVAHGHTQFTTKVGSGTDGELHLACMYSGELHLVGRVNDASDFELDATFTNCTGDEVTIDGQVSLVAALDIDVDIDDDDQQPDHAGAAVTIDYTGQLAFSGEVEGTCNIDTHVHAGAVVFDGYAAAGVTVEGTLCGNDADLVVHEHHG